MYDTILQITYLRAKGWRTSPRPGSQCWYSHQTCKVLNPLSDIFVLHEMPRVMFRYGRRYELDNAVTRMLDQFVVQEHVLLDLINTVMMTYKIWGTGTDFKLTTQHGSWIRCSNKTIKVVKPNSLSFSSGWSLTSVSVLTITFRSLKSAQWPLTTQTIIQNDITYYSNIVLDTENRFQHMINILK